MQPKHLPLVSQFDNRSSSTTKDAKLVNCYVDLTNKDRPRVIKRPGHDAGTLYEAGALQGLTTYLGVARLVVNNKFFKTSATSVAIDAGGLDVDFV
jgi:hypothetical protein